jgi:integrase
MSESHSITPPEPRKPAKPYLDFPLFAHASGQWAKKAKGKMRYFGPWSDPDAAEARYQAEQKSLAAGRTPRRKRRRTGKVGRPIAPGKPAKPYPDFPLFPHSSGQWAKKIRGHMHYFGKWDDPDAALNRYLEQKDALHAGRKPRPEVEGTTIKDAVNAFLRHKLALRDAGELSPRTWMDYKAACDMIIASLGKGRLVDDLDNEDFAKLRNKMVKRWSAVRVRDFIQRIRSVFKHALEAGLIDRPVRFGPGFARPSKKTLRLERAKKGIKMYEAGEMRLIIAAANQPLRAMILLGINCGFGNADCGTLPLSALDLERGWLNFPRPKTGTPRRCSLWPETIDAIKEALERRSTPRNSEDAEKVFITAKGGSWHKKIEDNPISKETRKLLDALGINGHRNFYALRHTFETIGGETKDQVAVDHIMGHTRDDMATAYRERISDERLRAVVDYVRRWLFPSTATIKSVE